MDDNLPTLSDLAWCVVRCRDAQKAMATGWSALKDARRIACEKALDDMVAKITYPPLPFKQKGDMQ